MVHAPEKRKEKTRLSGEARKAAIAMAAVPIFARKGFEGTTTKDLARAAQVSEALLYRHFPSKESLHVYIQDQICQTNSALHDFVESLEPGSRSLVMMVFLLFEIILGSKDTHPMGNAIPRLIIRSMLEDGQFTRSFHEPRWDKMLPLFVESCEAATQAGEMIPSRLTHQEKQWFSHHLAMALRLGEMPPDPIFNYQSSDENRKHAAIWFSLRGIGLKDEVIEKLFLPQRIEPIIRDVLVRAGMRTHPAQD